MPVNVKFVPEGTGQAFPANGTVGQVKNRHTEFAGRFEQEKFTTPVRPMYGVTFTVVPASAPCGSASVVAIAVMPKSPFTVTLFDVDAAKLASAI